MIIIAIPFIILTTIFWSLVNYIDKYLIAKVVNKNIGSLVIFSGFIGLPVSLIIFFANPTVILVTQLEALSAFLAGVFFIASLIPYFKSLEKEDVSIVGPMFLLIPVFSGVLAWVFLGEKLSIVQIIGSLIILLATFILSVNMGGKLYIPKKVFFLMATTSLLQAITTVLFKGVALEIDIWKTMFWENIGQFSMGFLVFILVKKYRKGFFKVVKTKGRKTIILNIYNEILNVGGNIFFRMSFILMPIVIAEILTESLQPVILLILGIILAKFWPKFNSDDFSNKELLRKSIAFSIMIIGIIFLSL